MLLHLATGDAYGAGFEYVPDTVVRKNSSNLEYINHQKHIEITAGKYTDDTQMSLAIAELLIDDKEITPLALASKFTEVFHRDKRTGYAGGFYKFLSETYTGEDFLAKILPHSNKNGAAMRASPVGFLPTIDEVLALSELQAKITHNTEIGITSSHACALSFHYFYYKKGEKKYLPNFLNEILGTSIADWTKPFNQKVLSPGWMAVSAAVTSIVKYNTMSDVLISSIDYTGDVDTVAAISLAMASASTEIENDLPEILYEQLENETYGKDYIIDLDNKLMKKYQSK
jgi:ADP-ribosyl-[dinitrogen reductase] hydrolase